MNASPSAAFISSIPLTGAGAFGLDLTKAALDYIGDRNAGLDGVEAMAAKYARLGYRKARRSSPPQLRSQAAASVDTLLRSSRSRKCPSGQARRRRAGRNFFASRDRFLERWIGQPRAVGLAFIGGGQLKGYGVLRKCRVGYKIGPLFADASDIAEALFGALCNSALADPVFIDIPEPTSGPPARRQA